MRTALALAFVCGLTEAWAQGPAPAQSAPAFEVVSVKPNNSGSGSSSTRWLPNGQFVAINIPLRSLIVGAFGVRTFQVTGGPGWVESSRFDVIAKIPEGVPQSQTPAMLRTLLKDRFTLTVRSEMREQPIHALVTARGDAALGPQMKPSTLVCSGPGAPTPQPGLPSPCGLNTSVNSRTGRIIGGAQTLDDIAAAIGNFATSRMVVNRTGLEGAFDFELRWTVDNLIPASSGAAADEPPSLVTAIQEQLGLKLDSGRGPVEMLVIDSVEQPTPD